MKLFYPTDARRSSNSKEEEEEEKEKLDPVQSTVINIDYSRWKGSRIANRPIYLLFLYFWTFFRYYINEAIDRYIMKIDRGGREKKGKKRFDLVS